MSIQQISADAFRQRLAGLENPEQRFTPAERDEMTAHGKLFVLAIREVFGSTLDRITVWERTSNGIVIAAAKSGGLLRRFVAAMLDYVKAEANVVAGNETLAQFIAATDGKGEDWQRQFIRACVTDRMLLVIEARGDVERARNLRTAVSAPAGTKATIDPITGEIMVARR